MNFYAECKIVCHIALDEAEERMVQVVGSSDAARRIGAGVIGGLGVLVAADYRFIECPSRIPNITPQDAPI